MKQRFETFKAETLPIVEHFKGRGKCVEIDTSQPREVVYDLLRAQLADQTESEHLERSLSEQAEILLGLRPWPRKA